VGKYVYPMVRQFFARAVFVSTRAISRLARRCLLFPAVSAALDFPGAGARTPKPCSSKSFPIAIKSEIALCSLLPVAPRHRCRHRPKT